MIITVFINPGSFRSAPPARRTSPIAAWNTTRSPICTPSFSPRRFSHRSGRSIIFPYKDVAGRCRRRYQLSAICAFTVAFNHPDWFSKVISDVGSFTGIRGGDAYPQLVRDAGKKPLRVHLEDGTNDNRSPDNPKRDWYLPESTHARGPGGHELRCAIRARPRHSWQQACGAVFPDTLRWIWRDEAPGAIRNSPTW